MVLYVEMEEIVEANGVICGDEKVVVADLFGDLERRSCLGPVLPYKLFTVVEHVKHMYLLWNFHSEDDGENVIIRIQFEGS